jgi:HECT-domain (ubiquitin-transferase)
MSHALPICCPCPNNKTKSGNNQEMWVLNPSTTSPDQLQMFAFLGKLIGVAARTKNFLEVNLAPIVWKMIVEEPISIADVRDVDELAANTVERYKHGVYTDDYFEAVDLTFSYSSFSGEVVELHPGGHAEVVTAATKDRYVEELEQFLLNQLKLVASAVRAGLSTIIPPGIVRLMNGK